MTIEERKIMTADLIQERIEMIKRDVNPYFVAELETGYIVLGDHQRFEGYTLFLCKSNKSELHQLDEKTKLGFLKEMSLVAECVWNAFKPEKLNYELLGNGYPHMHWHIFPRYKNDGVKGPVWWLPLSEMKVVYSEKEMIKLKRKLIRAIKNNKDIQNCVVRIAQI